MMADEKNDGKPLAGLWGKTPIPAESETAGGVDEDEGTEAAPAPAKIAHFPSQSGDNLLPMRTPPHSQDAEQAILGGLMMEPTAFDEVADRLEPKSFYFGNHKVIYEAIVALQQADRPTDAMMVAEFLAQRGLIDAAGGREYLASLVDAVFTTANIGAYSDIVQDAALKRQLISLSSEIGRKGFESGGLSGKDLLQYAEKEIFTAAEAGSKTEKGFRSLTDVLTETVDRISELYENGGDTTGVSTGFQELDEMTSGLHPADLVIVAARPSMGKTTFSMNIAENVAISSGKAVAVFSMEMPSDQLAMRMISSIGRIDQGKVRNGRLDDSDWTRMSGAIGQLSQAKLFIDDTPALSPTDLRSRARRLHRQHDLGMIVIDYLQLMQIPGHKENRTNEISEISRSLKALAKELEIPVIALSQLNRSLEQRTNKRPVMSDLRESGAIEQDADVILFLYRDEVYDANTPHKGLAEVVIGKQRNGPIGSIMLKFLGHLTKFEDLSEGESYGYGGDYLPPTSPGALPPDKWVDGAG